MRDFKEIDSKDHFQPKRGVWGQNPTGGQTRIFSKIRLEHFFRLTKMYLCAKNHQNLMRRFLDMKCDGRTHARTHERESIGLSGLS